MRTLESQESKVEQYVNEMMEERRRQEKRSKQTSRNLKQSASLFVAKRMNAIVLKRNETLENTTKELKLLYEAEDANNFVTKK